MMGCAFFNWLITIMMVLVGVAYVTLLERKVLGLVQRRLGPNKVGAWGVLQPLVDGVKLLSKGGSDFLFGKSIFLYYFLPGGLLLIMVIVWSIIPLEGWTTGYENGILLIMVMTSLGVIPIMMGGWYSGSFYGMVGAVRSISQTISYEVVMFLLVVSYVILSDGFSLYSMADGPGLIYFIPLGLVLFICILMELNRSPADLIEGESELVSGFNTEYYGMGFAFIFIGEYGMIMFMGCLYMILVCGIFPSTFLGLGVLTVYLYLVVLIRGFMPRVRYDQLMMMCWTQLVFIGLGYFSLMVGWEGILNFD